MLVDSKGEFILLKSTHFWPQPLLGLDIQSDEIRLLQLQRAKKKCVIKKTVAMPLPVGSVVDGKIQEIEVVGDCLQKLVQDNRLQEHEVAIALPASSVLIQRISVARGLDEAEIEAEVISHLHHALPGVTEGLCYDYVMPNQQEDIQNDVLVVATAFLHLNTPLTVVQNAGLKVRVVDVDQYALDRANQIVEQQRLSIEKKWLISLGLALRSSCLW